MIERYTLPEMGALWTDRAKYRSWLDVEIQAAKAMAKYGYIPKKAAQTIAQKADFRVDRINEIEAEVNHDVIAFLTSVAEFVGEPSKYVHFGLTSSDVLDTALSLQIKKASVLLDKKIKAILARIKRLAMKYKSTPCIGRTHGVVAEPTTAGLKFAVWYTELQRRHLHFQRAAETMAVGAISGAVGNYANVDPRVEKEVCRKLGLETAKVTTQVIQRDRHAEYLNSLALLATSLEKFATEIRNLQRSEIGEMAEGFTKGQKGSSAMPHKKNPITAERVTGIARVLRGYALTAMENVPLWHERDIAHSSVERIIIPDATILLDYGLQKFLEVLKGLVVDPKRMMTNIFYGGGLVFSQQVLLKLTGPAGSREKAYRIVQRNAMIAQGGKGLFKELLLGDAEVRQYLSEAEIANCFEVSYYTKHVDTIFKRVFGK
jgi:adenylosuccinate lyase